MARIADDEEEDSSELSQFVERIATLFEENDVSSAQVVLAPKRGGRSTSYHLSGYRLHQSGPMKTISSQTEAEKKERIYSDLTHEQLEHTKGENRLMESVIDAHWFTLKQDLHFDAFRKLLYEKGLLVREVVDWKIQHTKGELAKIKEWGKEFSAVEVSPNMAHKVCIISREPTS